MLEDQKQLIYIGSDHAGYEEKQSLHEFLETKNYQVIDLGCFKPVSCDYPDIAREVGEKVLENPGAFGILICGTGIGMSISANKLKGIRAALCKDERDAEMARLHNNANILAMGARTMGKDLHQAVAMKFLTTGFEGDKEGGERHAKRVEKMHEIEKK